ncbi:MAG: ExbD/TolR family protein [Akkermansiaceae bacterium]
MEFHRVNRKIPPVPIIPLIDILAILLIYFAVAYDPKIERHTLPIQLPLAHDSIVIEVTGSTSVLAIAKDGSVTLDATRIHEGLLVDYLKAFKENFPNRSLELEPDKELPLQNFVKVQYALIQAGIDPKDVYTRVRIPESELESNNE